VTAEDFRTFALSLPDAIESAHMHHPDFRVRGKIFATLGYPDKDWAVAKLTPEQQNLFVQSDSKTFRPAKGAWGRRGNTKIYLPRAKIDIVRDALTLAWRNVAPKHLQQNF
jgi:hypothetical protein